MARYDMFNNVHKGIRRTLCSLLADAGNHAELRPIAQRWHALQTLLEAHHAHEDRFIAPHLARIAPELHAQLERDHAALHGEISSLGVAASELENPQPTAAAELGRAFYRRLAAFVAQYFLHMADEEGAYNAALQTAYDDAQLAAIEGELVASIAPDMMAAFMHVMLPALDPSERLALLDDVRQHAPAPAFIGMCQLAEASLEPEPWQRLQADLFGRVLLSEAAHA